LKKPVPCKFQACSDSCFTALRCRLEVAQSWL
jgi:hypothetical protein